MRIVPTTSGIMVKKSGSSQAESFGMTDGLGMCARLLTLAMAVTFTYEGILL